MLKRIFLTALALCLLLPAFSQEKINVEMLGKKKGAVKILKENGNTYADALALGKILKMQTSWFGKSGQLNLKNAGGYFCVLRRGSAYAAVNGKEEALAAPALMKDGALYAPLSFFEKGSIADAAGYDITLESGALSIEKFYNLEFLNAQSGVDESKITFRQKIPLKKEINTKAKNLTEVFLPKAVLKREETLKPKDKFIDRVEIKQAKDGTRIIFTLNKAAGYHDFYEAPGDTLVFEAAQNKIERPVLASAPGGAEPEQPKPAALEEDAFEDFDEEAFFAAPPSPAPAQAARPQGQSAAQAIKKTLPPSTAAKIDKPGPKTRKARILIDPGHGGKDPGAMRPGSAKEKEINLSVAKTLYDLLRKEGIFDVRISRSDDTFIPLGGRAKMANDFRADIFISVHSNAAKRPSADGFEVYFRSDKASSAEAAETAALENEALQYEGKSPTAVSFADLLLKSLAGNEYLNESSKVAGHIRTAAAKEARQTGIKVYQNSAIKQANFYVLRGVEAPAVLVELGYLSNSGDKKRLNNKAARAKLAECIKNGVLSYAKAEGWK